MAKRVKTEVEKFVEEKGVNIEKGKPLNKKTHEYVCTECMEKASRQCRTYCVELLPTKDVGKCSCGNITTTKAVEI